MDQKHSKKIPHTKGTTVTEILSNFGDDEYDNNNKSPSENVEHMDPFRHDKIVCSHRIECDAFSRLIQNGYRQDDIVHCSIYFHQDRRGGMTVTENFGSKKFISAYQDWEPYKKFELKFWDDTITEGDLIKELEKNGFGYVMKPTSGPYRHLDEIVQEKLQHPRHKRMGSPLSYDQMLSIILYCNSNAYADMRWDDIQFSMQDFGQINNGVVTDYKLQKWPIFGKVLNTAICRLNKYDIYQRPKMVYHGLRDIEIDPNIFNIRGRAAEYSKQQNKQFFKYGTFVSTSWDREIALGFMGPTGCLIEIDTADTGNWTGDGRLIGADVSWISKFLIEAEFLIARLVTFEIQNMYFDKEQNCQILKVKAGRYSHYKQQSTD